MTTEAPYGSWSSPIDAAFIAAVGDVWSRFDRPEPVGRRVLWLEALPEEGRTVLMSGDGSAAPTVLTPEGFDVRTSVHEYGGGAWFRSGETVFFSNRSDQRLYRSEPGAAPRAITPPAAQAAGGRSLRYADGSLVGDRIVCVRERHEARDVVNELVALPPDGSAEPIAIAAGHDFYAFPTADPNGERLAWTSWDHPQLPFIGTELWTANMRRDGGLATPRHVAGGPEESIFQPSWSPSGELHFVSDRTGWWNLYRERNGAVEAVAPVDAELGWPQWFFGLSSYTFLADGRIACLMNVDGTQRLALLDPATGRYDQPALPYTAVKWPLLRSDGRSVVFVAATPTTAPAVVRYDVPTGRIDVIRRAVEHVNESLVSRGERLEISTLETTVHAWYYPPRNADLRGPPDELPPLVVLAHGGPTDQAPHGLRPDIQLLTSRGIAVADVDYSGSTGYGRAFRERLTGRWGIADTADCVHVARYLAESGAADPKRLAVMGGSAGGFIVYCALAFHSVFQAGVALYGISDLESFGLDTHKFEAAYARALSETDDPATLRARSPASSGQIGVPVLILQGLDDHIVPPSQSERMVETLRRTGTDCRYLAFAGQGHGFQSADSLRRASRETLAFLGEVFGFTPSLDPPGAGEPRLTRTERA